MANKKSSGKLHSEKERLKLKEREVESVFEDKSLVPDEQNRMKGTEPARE